MHIRHLAPSLGVLALLLAFGCAGGSGILSGDPPSGPVAQSGPQPFGQYTLLVFNGQASLTPVSRTQGFGDSAGYDATQYFTGSPCNDCAKIAAVGLTIDGNVAVDVAIRHPFRDTSERLDLDAFDVRGILGVDGVVSFPDTPGILELPLSTDPGALQNADGYTTHFGDALTTGDATLNPFKRYFTEDDPDPEVRGAYLPNHRMAMASDWDIQRYLLKPTDGPQSFDFLIEVSYGQPARSPFNGTPADEPGGWLNPIYFLPEFHQKEASIASFAVDVAPPSATAGTLELSASASDWQQLEGVDETYPNPEFTTGLSAASEIAGLMLEIPGLNIYTEEPTATTGTGTGGDPFHWSFAEDLPPLAEGQYPALLTVIDDRYDPLALNATNKDHRAFHVATVRIQPGGVSGLVPIALIGSDPNPPVAILRDATFAFNAINSYDPEQVALTTFEWDEDYDGETFDVDLSTDDRTEGPLLTYDEEGTYTVALRVRNAEGEQSDVVSVSATVNPNPIIPSPSLTWIRGINASPSETYVRIDEATDSAIAVASDGTVHCVYTREEEAIFLGTDYWVQYQKISANGTLSPVEEVYHELRLDSLAPRTAIAVSPSGNPAVVFALGSEINYSVRGSGGWTEPLVIAAADDWIGEDLGQFDFAIASNSRALAYEVIVPSNNQHKVLVTFYNDGEWNAEENCGTAFREWGSSGPSITAHGSGYVVAWDGSAVAPDQQHDIFVRRWVNNAFLPKENVATHFEDERGASVAVTGSTVAVCYPRFPNVYGKVSYNGQPFGTERVLFQQTGTIAYVEPVIVGGADGSLACLALEKASGGQILGQPVLLAFDHTMEFPLVDGILTRNLQVPAPGDPEYHWPDIASNGNTQVAAIVEIAEEGWQQLRVIQGSFQLP